MSGERRWVRALDPDSDKVVPVRVIKQLNPLTVQYYTEHDFLALVLVETGSGAQREAVVWENDAVEEEPTILTLLPTVAASVQPSLRVH